MIHKRQMNSDELSEKEVDECLNEFAKNLKESQEDLPPEFKRVWEENYMELLA